MVTFIFALFTGENLSCVSLVGVRSLVLQCHRGHSHVSLFEFYSVAAVGVAAVVAAEPAASLAFVVASRHSLLRSC